MAYMKNTNKILTFSALAAIGYVIYKKVIPSLKTKSAQQKSQDVIQNIKDEQEKADQQQRKENERTKIIQQGTSIANPNSFASKVARIQGILGVAIDGVPGRVTNGEYQKRFGLDKGPITVVNVSYYLDKALSDTKFLGL
jgi:hypothetical protein